ncbi:GAK system CofD-like protein [Tropicimonas sediminicola]|uniref:CofD-related protein, GAK system n=1 Tax=Tropicimonas sediminicola TaxID=1031541 RepID=A0A239LDF0_9RHOB|nr:GAK system CofD-like protein [Tropicimonas sediminicola]SNT27972.1 CofD-related protein, GAK system [Tropicimonas sediminicola]
MSDLNISRNAEIPDALRIARAKASPNLGPRLLFFSGGSALNGISRRLKAYTHNSAHLITPFDSGGSSQILRLAFDMPAVGDLRSRLMALADESDLGQPDIFALFNHRLPAEASRDELEAEFRALLDGSHKLMRDVFQPMRSLILRPLHAFAQDMPDGFDLRHASIGNLILAGGYLTNERALEPVLFLMSKMVAVQGTVRAIVDENLQIGAELADGSHIVGQRNLTGKETAPLSQSIRRVYLSDGEREIDPRKVRLPKRNRRLIESADLICYPPGSLFTSVIANLLPQRVGTSIAARSVPKVYVPSLGTDPECVGLDLSGQVAALLSALRRDAGEDCPTGKLLSLVLYDARSVEPKAIRDVAADHAVTCVPADLASADRPDRYDPDRLCDALVSLT